MDRPKTGKGVLVLAAIVIFAILAIYASTLGGIAVLAGVVTVVAYAAYASGVRFHKWVLGE